MTPDPAAVPRIDRRITSDNLTRWFFVVVLGSLVAAVGVIGLFGWHFWGPLADQTNNWGEFGDYVGGVLNPFFGFLALVGLLLTIMIQSRELHISAAELRNSANALSRQNESIQRQNFESTFFQLIRLQANISDQLEIRDAQHQVTQVGRSCFRAHYEALLAEFEALAGEMAGDASDLIRTAYERFNRTRHEVLGHYFRHLYHLTLFAKQNAPDEPYRYVRLVRAQLSSFEQTLLFYSCLSPFGASFKPLVEEFSLLHNMDESLLLDPSHRELYAERAFQRPPDEPR